VSGETRRLRNFAPSLRLSRLSERDRDFAPTNQQCLSAMTLPTDKPRPLMVPETPSIVPPPPNWLKYIEATRRRSGRTEKQPCDGRCRGLTALPMFRPARTRAVALQPFRGRV